MDATLIDNNNNNFNCSSRLNDMYQNSEDTAIPEFVNLTWEKNASAFGQLTSFTEI